MVDHRRYLVIDIGTSSLKAAVATSTGELLSSIRRPVMGPADSTASFDGYRWIEALRETIPVVAGQYRIDAVVISGNGPTVVACDEDGRILGQPLLWLDPRAETLPESRSFYLPKILWFHRNDPHAEQVRWYLPFPEYLLFYLTGRAVAVTPGSEFCPYIWEPDEAATVGLDPRKLPPFAGVGSVVGEVLRHRSAELGLPAGTPVVAAGSDFLMSLIGTNCLKPGMTCDRAGTSEGINYCSDRPRQAERLRTLPHVIPGLYNVAGILSSTGLLFEWFREISGQRGRDYGDMMLEIMRLSDDADLPWFFPSLQQPGAWQFRRGMFIGLGAQHSRAEMGRAVVLSIGFAVREALELLGGAGCSVEGLVACGGQARNGLWTQMKADMTGVPVSVPAVADAELIGNLCCGMVALGEAASLEEAAARTVHIVHTYQPDPAGVLRYAEQHHRYQARFQRFQEALAEC